MLGDVKTVSLTADSPYLTQEPFDQQWARILDKSPSVAVERRAGSVAQEYRSLAFLAFHCSLTLSRTRGLSLSLCLVDEPAAAVRPGEVSLLDEPLR